jgi:hypothetical protein
MFEMEGVLFLSYAINEPSCNIEKKLDHEFDGRSCFFNPFQSEVLKYYLNCYDVAIWTKNIIEKYIQQVL